MTRPTKDEYFLDMAAVVATRSTCLRRAVGCVLTDWDGHVLATGYNGRPAGLAHCNEATLYSTAPGQSFETHYPRACPGARSESGTDLDGCEAVHAEQNALLQCPDVRLVDTCYVTVSPCLTCVKLLMNTGCRRIVFIEPYAHDDDARELWTRELAGTGRSRRLWLHGPDDGFVNNPDVYG